MSLIHLKNGSVLNDETNTIDYSLWNPCWDNLVKAETFEDPEALFCTYYSKELEEEYTLVQLNLAYFYTIEEYWIYQTRICP